VLRQAFLQVRARLLQEPLRLETAPLNPPTRPDKRPHQRHGQPTSSSVAPGYVEQVGKAQQQRQRFGDQRAQTDLKVRFDSLRSANTAR
jgi:hypothetical protein